VGRQVISILVAAAFSFSFGSSRRWEAQETVTGLDENSGSLSAMISDVADGVLAEVERSLEAFLAVHAHPASIQHLDSLVQEASSCGWKQLGDSDEPSAQDATTFHRDLAQLQWVCAFAASRALDPILRHLLSWIHIVELRAVASSRPSTQPRAAPSTSVVEKQLGSWLAARLLVVVFDAATLPAASPETDQLATIVLDRCLKVFEVEHEMELKQSQHSSGGFFSAFMSSVPALKPSSHIPSATSTLSEGDAGAESATSIQHHALIQWRLVFGRAARVSARVTRAKLQSALAKPGLVTNVPKMSVSQLYGDTSQATIPHPYLQFLTELPLRLVDDVNNPSQRLKDGALLLRLFFPLLGKPFKSRVRRGAAVLVASLLRRERDAMDRDQFKILLALAPVNEWNSCVSELHAIALKLSQKRKTLAAGWELRASVLTLAPSDIFARYWKDDMHALLRLQYRHSKDGSGISLSNVTNGSGTAEGSAADSVAGTILRCVGVSFTNFVLRHLLAERRGGSPSESDCMEIINTAQAWCFFSSHRQKSFVRFRTSVVPVLIELSVAIAAFNMRYAIQSHLRRLLTEADSVVDDKKLVGLKVLLELCRISQASDSPSDRHTSTNRLGFTLDTQTFSGNIGALGEIAGHILILCNTLLGHDLLFDQLSSVTSAPSSVLLLVNQAHTSNATMRLLRDDTKRKLAVEIFATALRTLEFVYNHLELRSDQKVLLLARASIHSDASIRESANTALLAVTANTKLAQAGAILRGMTDYLVRMTSNHAQANDAEPIKLLMRLCGSLLSAATHASLRSASAAGCWEDASRVRESFLQVEAAAVFLLTHDHAQVRLAAVETLEVVQELRATVASDLDPQHQGEPEIQEAVDAVDVIEALEPALKERFFTFQPPGAESKASQSENGILGHKLWHFRCLAGEWNDARHGFRWSMCLALVLPALATASPQLVTYFWTDANDKVSKLEPVIATANDGYAPRFGSSGGNISRWRNLSIFATASACRALVLASPSNMSKSTGSPINSSSASCPTAQSAISSSAIAALLKRLGRYLKSASVEQQKAAIVALSATHCSSHSLLIDVLSRCETDAFSEVAQEQASTVKPSSRTDSFDMLVRPANQQPSGTPLSNSVSRRYSKYSINARSSRTTTQLQTQWAILRLYRLLLESVLTKSYSCLSGKAGADATAHTSDDELLLSATSSFLVRMGNALDLLYSDAVSVDRGARGATLLLAETGGNMLFMIQQDFCEAVQMLLKYLMMLERVGGDSNNNHEDGTSLADVDEHPETQQAPVERSTIGSYVNEARTAQWSKLLLSWCASFSSLADSSMEEHLDGTFIASSSPLYDAWTTSCDVFGVRERESGETLPWLWLDDSFLSCIKISANQDASSHRYRQHRTLAGISSTRFLRFFTCHCAFSTLITVVDSSPSHFLAADLASGHSPIFSWLDECFAVDTSRLAAHFSVLQQLCHLAAKRFLDIDRDGVFRSICIEKACFRRSSGAGHAIAKQYMLALSTQAGRISVELLDTCNSTSSFPATDATAGSANSTELTAMYGVQFMYALLLHLGATADPADFAANDLHRAKIRDFVSAVLPPGGSECEQARRWLGSLAVTAPHHSTVLATEVRNRIQVAAASALASSFPGLRFAVCVAVFNFLDCCDIVIQRSMLGAILPLLVDTRSFVVPSRTGRLAFEQATGDVSGPTSIDALLEVMFKLTMSISDTCAEQLDRAWLTLAYSSTSTSIEASLLTIVTFLVKMSQTPEEAATAKLILWWLSRWQDAAFRVLSVFCGFIETQRLPRHSSSQDLPPNPPNPLASEVATTKTPSLDGIAVFVTLMSDACCHLQQCASSTFKEVAIQTIHYALLLHFTSFPPTPGRTSSSIDFPSLNPLKHLESSTEPQLDERLAETSLTGSVLSTDIRRDCVVLLQTMTQFLVSATTPDALVNAMSAITSCIDGHLAHTGHLCLMREKQGQAKVNADVSDYRRAFLNGVMLIAQSISTDDALVWGDMCVKEIALVLSSVTNSPPETKLSTSATIEARFAVVTYGFLAPVFNGDVFLAVLELLHVALDEHLREPASFEPLICDCLTLLARMVDRMPDSKLALYPQVLWVCTALLNHFTTTSALQSTLELVSSLLRKPMLVTNEILVDVIMCKRPAQWSSDQSSLLRALVSKFHIGDQRARRITITMVARCVLLLPESLLMATVTERAIMCSVGLLPVVITRSRESSSRITSIEVLESACNDLAAQWESVAAHSGFASAVETSQTGCEAIRSLTKFFQTQANAYSHLRGTPSSSLSSVNSDPPAGMSPRETISAFVRAFVPTVTALKPLIDGLALTFEVLTRALSSIDSTVSFGTPATSTSSEASAAMSEMDDGVFILAEELLLAMEATSIRWHPPPAFTSALNRIVCTPRRRVQWQSAVRLLTYVSMEREPCSTSPPAASTKPAEPPEVNKKLTTVTTHPTALTPSVSTPKR
jgi:hypothetical protein